MKNKIPFIIISIMIAVILFTTAATCNLCGIQPSGETRSEQKEENTKQDSKQASSESQESDGKSKSSAGQSKDSSDSKSNIEITDIIIGDIIDEHVEPVDFLLTDSTYTCYPVLATPPDGTETYKWSVSGGSNDNFTFYMQWNTPPDEGTYTVSLEITKDSGSSGKIAKEFQINLSSAIGEPLPTPTIVDIEVSGSSDGHYYANTSYVFNIITEGPTELIDRTVLTVSKGTILSNFGNEWGWESPDTPGECIITANILDEFSNIMDTKSIVLTIE